MAVYNIMHGAASVTSTCRPHSSQCSASLSSLCLPLPPPSSLLHSTTHFPANSPPRPPSSSPTHPGDTVDYIVTGAWSKKAYEEASKFGLNANLVAKGDNKSVPGRDSWKLSPDAKYVHYCDNETIGGECSTHHITTSQSGGGVHKSDS